MICFTEFTLLFDTYNRSFRHGGHGPRPGPREPAEVRDSEGSRRAGEERVRYGAALFAWRITGRRERR